MQAGSDAKISQEPSIPMGDTADQFDQTDALNKDGSIRILADGRDGSEFDAVKFPTAHQTMEAAPFRSPDQSAYGFQIGSGHMHKNRSTVGGRLKAMMSDTLHSTEHFHS